MIVNPIMNTTAALITIDKNAHCDEALELMKLHQIHHLIVIENGDPVGIISDRDILFKWIRATSIASTALGKLPIEPIARIRLPVIKPETSLSQTLNWMGQYGTSAMLSRNDQGNWGIVTETDLLRALDKILIRVEWRKKLLIDGESVLSAPLVQKLMEMLSQMGL